MVSKSGKENSENKRIDLQGVSSSESKSMSSGVFYLGLHNLLNGYVSNLFIGEKEIVKTVMERQRRYLERIMGWVIQQDKDNHLTFSSSFSAEPVMTISMLELDMDGARRYFELKRQAQKKGIPFFGIVSHEVGQTDILHPIDPDTGQLKFPVNV